MDNAAHAESLDHEVYRTPLAVQPEFEFRKTPANYRLGHLGERPLPDQMKVWRVQDTPKGNVIAIGSGFEDSPDAEILAVGLNRLKKYGDVGIGRHASVLQWGYGDPPSKMTGPGRRLFINCIHYIRRFEGKVPLVHRESEAREHVLRWDTLAQGTTRQRLVFAGSYSQDIMQEYKDRSDELNAYCVKHRELLYWDGGYRIDEDLKSLGIQSNRRVETLNRLIELLQDSRGEERARRALTRYTCESFVAPREWRRWFDENKNRIYFTDIGGYKFLVVPEGYLDAK